MGRSWGELYLLQDRALARIRRLDHGFYLSGGTALSRGYFHHRHSEDLDFFANDVEQFGLWRDRCLSALVECARQESWRLEIVLRDDRFGRAILHGTQPLKLEFVNDVPFHRDDRSSRAQRHR
jgi:hypothetical protein